MKTYYIVTACTTFKVKKVEAAEPSNAEDIAYDVEPKYWDHSITSDECEHMETVEESEIAESAFLKYLGVV